MQKDAAAKHHHNYSEAYPKAMKEGIDHLFREAS
jgi:hypothetical protein